jgi:hypothetical protein
MTQTFEFYVVDPSTWKDVKKINTITSASITRDQDADTRGSATFDITGDLEECYVRVYLVTIQNGLRETHPLGTFLVQSPSSNFDGKVKTAQVDGYTPLIELKEKNPPIGYAILKKTDGANDKENDDANNVMNHVYRIVGDVDDGIRRVRAPVISASGNELLTGDFVSNVDDNWLTFCIDLAKQGKHTVELDELGRIHFAPEQELESLQPTWTYDDSNSSILYPDISLDHDLFGIPNVVEVIYSGDDGCQTAKAINNDPNSPTSIANRGRTITYRESNPSFTGVPTEAQLQEYADKLLKALSTVEYTVSYTHGYCPVRLGDCVRLNYTRAGITNVKAKVIRQTIRCTPGCSVAETAIFTSKLWEG